MRKTIVALLTGVMASALLMSGCQASKGLENDDIKITQYKGVEIDEVEKASEITALLTGVMASALLMSGCQASKGLENDDIKITQYKGVEIDEVEKASEITDDDVDAYIQSMQESKAEVTEITDRAVEDGDTVSIDFVGKMNGEEFEGGSAQDYSLTIGSGVFIEGFEESVIGHKAGETYDWNGKFPEDYGNAEMAGKDVVFTITVNAITKEDVPELNDKFVKSVSEKSKTVKEITVNAITKEDVPELNDKFVKSVSEKSKTVKEYKKEVKELLQKDAETSYEYSIETAVWEKVMDNTEVKKYPKKEMNATKENWIKQYQTAAEYYQMEYETFIEEQMGMTVEDFEKQIDTAVKETLKEQMAVEAIADKEKIKLDDKTYKKELKNIVSDYGYENVDALKEAVEEKDLKKEALKNIVKEKVAESCIQVKSK